MASANRFTTTELLAAIRRITHLPSNASPFQDADLLALSDEECQTSILKQILSVRENYYLTYTDTAVNATGTYSIPTRAIGMGLADCQLIVGNSVYQIQRTEIGEQFSTVTSPTGFFSFYVQGNSLVLQPNPTTGSIRMWHYQRPNYLVATTAAAQITSIASNVLTFSTIPTTITTSTACDLIKDQPGFDWLAIDQTPTAVTTTTITFTTVPTTVAVGDWVSLAGQTAIPQMPVEFRPLLALRVAVKNFQTQGYLDKMKFAQGKLEEMEKALLAIINPRIVEEPKRLSPDSSLWGGVKRAKLFSAN
jgi:hypothetical protein